MHSPNRFKFLAAWDRPSTQSVTIVKDETTETSGTYAARTYTVEFETDGTPGAWLDDGTTQTARITQTVNSGGDCPPVSAAAPEGYNFRKWTLGEVADPPYSTSGTLTVKNVTENMNLTAWWGRGGPPRPTGAKDWTLFE